MSWSDKYKRSINCDSPKGFSQRAHCAARKKRAKGESTKSKSPFNEMLEHCGCEDDAVQELESGLKKLDNTSYDSIDSLMRRIMKKHDMTAKQLHTAFVDKHHKTPDDWINEGTLHHWFKGSKSKDGKPGWVQADGSPCANEPGETKTPKCFSSGRLKALKRKGKKGESLIRSAVRRKRQKDKGQQAKSGAAKPTNVLTFAKGRKDKNYIKAEPGIKESMELNEASKDKKGKGSGTKDACYHKVKARYDVWPSAYASGALVKCRRVGAANWGTKSEETIIDEGQKCWPGYKKKGTKKMFGKIYNNCVKANEETEMIRYCPKCKKDETRGECKYGEKYWDMYSLPTNLSKKYTPNTPHPGNFPEGYDHEYSMARSELSTIIGAAKRLRKKMKRGEGNIEAWVQSKITKAADYIDTAADYVDSGEMKSEGVESGPILPTEKGRRVFPKDQEPKPTGAKLPVLQKAHYNPEGEQINEIGPLVAAGLAAGALAAPYLAKKFLSKPINQALDNATKTNKLPLATGGNMQQLRQAKQSAGMKEENLKTFSEFMIESSAAWQRKEGKNPEGGLNRAGIASYRREHPGSKLSLAVTTKPSKLKKGSKAAKRRKSFCARMSGMKKRLTSAKTARDPNSRINKSLRKWNC